MPLPASGASALTGGAIRDLVAAHVDTSVPEPMGAYLFGPDDEGAEIGRHVERAVLMEAFGNTPELLAEEYGRYEPTSLFFCVVDHRRRLPVGVIRIILPRRPDTEPGAGLKSLADLERVWGESAARLLERTRVPMRVDATWDIATLAVMADYRGAAAAGLVSLGLYQSVMRTARRVGIDWMVAVLDATVYRMSRLKFQRPFVPLAEGRSYLGSTSSLPVYLHVSDWRDRLAAGDPTICDVIFAGSGIEAALRPLELGPAVALVERLGSVPGVGPTDGDAADGDWALSYEPGGELQHPEGATLAVVRG